MNERRENSTPPSPPPPAAAAAVFSMDIETDAVQKHSFWWSARMTYTICAFLAMFLHHCMRSAVNYSVLCMVADNKMLTDFQNTTSLHNKSHGCETANDYKSGELRTYGDLSWTRNEGVMFQGIFYYGYILTMPFAGLLADKYGGKLLFVHSLTIEAVIFMLIPICARSSFWLASFARFCQGLISGSGTPALYQLFTVWAHPTERTAALTFSYSGFNIANLVIYPLSSLLCKLRWDYIFYVIGGVSVLIGASFHWLVYNSVDSHPRISPEESMYLKAAEKEKSKNKKVPWMSILKCAPFHVFILTHFCHTFGISMEALMLPRYLKEAMYFPIGNIGNISAIVFTGTLISKIVTIPLSLTLESKTSVNQNLFRKVLHLMCNISAVIIIICIILLNCHQRWIVVVLWTGVSIVTDIAFSGAYWPSLLYMAPSYSGLLVGIANCFGTSSAFLVPVVIANMVTTSTDREWDYVLMILGGVYLIDAFAFGIFGSTRLQPWGLHEDKPEAETTNSKKK